MNPMMNNPAIPNFMPTSPMQAAGDNPILNIFQSAKKGQNPMPYIYQLARQIPAFSQPLKMIDSKDVAAQKRTAINMAKEYGIDLNRFAAQFGINIEK